MSRLLRMLTRDLVRQGHYAGDLRTQVKFARRDAEVLLETVLRHRRDAFTPGNNKLWGEFGWIECRRCLDALGFPTYHATRSHG